MSEISHETNHYMENQHIYLHNSLTKSLRVICSNWQHIVDIVEKDLPWNNIYVIKENSLFELIIDCPNSMDLYNISKSLIEIEGVKEVKYER